MCHVNIIEGVPEWFSVRKVLSVVYCLVRLPLIVQLGSKWCCQNSDKHTGDDSYSEHLEQTDRKYLVIVFVKI